MTDQPTVDAAAQASDAALRRRTLRVTGGLAMSSVAVVIVGLARTKTVALVAGPEGVGILSLLLTAVSPLLALFTAGLGTSGPKRVAQARAQDSVELDAARRALVATSVALAVAGGAVTFLAADPIAQYALGDANLAGQTRLMALVVFMNLISAPIVGLWTGYGMFRRLAMAQPVAALLSSICAVAAVLAGVPLIAAVIVIPSIVSCTVLLVAARTIPKSNGLATTSAVRTQARGMLLLGGAVVFAAIFTTLAQFSIRLIADREAGIAGVGYFQAAFSLAGVGVALVLQALNTEYLPRLSALGSNFKKLNVTVNQQVEVSLLLMAALVAVGLAGAPLMIKAFYSAEFSESVPIIRFMLLAEFFRVTAVTVAYLYVALERRQLFIISEVVSAVLFALGAFVLVPLLGLRGAGVGYLVSQAILFVVVNKQANTASGFRLSKKNMRLMLGLSVGTGFEWCAGFAGAWAIPLQVSMGMLILLYVGFALLHSSDLIRRLPRPLRTPLQRVADRLGSA